MAAIINPISTRNVKLTSHANADKTRPDPDEI
jgi:hypothetical protein